MNGLIVGYLLNSIGSFLLWILLGPFVAAHENIATMGHLGMSRQLSFIVGALIGGVLADRGRPLLRQLIVETAQLASAVVLFLMVREESGNSEVQYLAWSTLRFGLSGISFVLGFRILAEFSGKLGNASILHLLVTQGATLIAPILGFFLPLITTHPMVYALLFDAVTTVVYIGVLLRALGGALDVRCEGSRLGFGTKLRESVTSYWYAELRPWSYLQFVLLIAMSGYAVISLETAKRQSYLPIAVAYALCSFVYGVALWTTSIWIKKVDDLRNLVLGGAALLVLSGVTFVLAPEEPFVVILSYIVYVFGFWISLHGSNKALLSLVPKERAGRVRSSMVFYLSVVFGLGELFLGNSFKDGSGMTAVTALRISAALIVLPLLKMNKQCQHE